ncbi:hypothetical protein TRVA0_052S00760 [Trichomonascus vanleenenianus]|uniref:uncharacterized protein n=1 Tax=Trichomonascus vanleenenianus TaxID=2268995 RepID=UPI003EC9FA26
MKYLLSGLALLSSVVLAEDAKEKSWADKTIVERVQAYDWTKEGIIVATLLAYVASHYWGVGQNKKTVNSWVSKHRDVLDAQFAQVGTNVPGQELVVADSPTLYTTYATGRTNVKSMVARMTLKGRQNIATLLVEYGLSMFYGGFEPKDEINVLLTPHDDAKIDSFVFAVVNKNVMNSAREKNYYLSLTRTTDSEKLPPYLTFMSENHEITEHMFTPELAEAVADSEHVLQWIAVTDLPSDRPVKLEDMTSRPRVHIVLKFPRNAKEEAASQRLVNAAINMVDVAVAKGQWRPEVSRKIKAVRETELKKVQKAIDDEKAEEAAQKKAEARREEKRQLAKLSPAELRKKELKEREREQKKKMKVKRTMR